ncbi:hypothetical protein [Luethyella okanaganae]|uniref:Uncharacterized protein n=1 Tax=Luethyella okanaganae TaxID=69372 RepID=A0ABW1VEV2_9MICO
MTFPNPETATAHVITPTHTGSSEDAPTGPAIPAPTPTPSPPTALGTPTTHPTPSVHVRAAITWLAIFPLVAVGMTLLGPVTDTWHPVLRALVLTLIVVPIAVYLVVPRLFAGYGEITRRRMARRMRA